MLPAKGTTRTIPNVQGDLEIIESAALKLPAGTNVEWAQIISKRLFLATYAKGIKHDGILPTPAVPDGYFGYLLNRPVMILDLERLGIKEVTDWTVMNNGVVHLLGAQLDVVTYDPRSRSTTRSKVSSDTSRLDLKDGVLHTDGESLYLAHFSYPAIFALDHNFKHLRGKGFTINGEKAVCSSSHGLYVVRAHINSTKLHILHNHTVTNTFEIPVKLKDVPGINIISDFQLLVASPETLYLINKRGVGYRIRLCAGRATLERLEKQSHYSRREFSHGYLEQKNSCSGEMLALVRNGKVEIWKAGKHLGRISTPHPVDAVLSDEQGLVLVCNANPKGEEHYLIGIKLKT